MSDSSLDPEEGSNGPLERLRRALAAAGVESENGARAGELVATLPGERKLRTVCSFVVGDLDLRVAAFVIRAPDENHGEFHRFLLRRNLRLPGLAYAIDGVGDVYLTGRFPVSVITADFVDRLLGAVLTGADEPFNELLALGFLTSMRKEWAWRRSRGESTANLEAFRHLLETTDESAEQGAESSAESSAE